MNNTFQDWGLTILTAPTENMFDEIYGILSNYEYFCYTDSDDYLIMAPKDLTNCKVGLVAHIDTVSDTQKIYSDLSCPDLYCSCGHPCFDDRLGILMILRAIINHDLKCVTIFLNEEEVGCIGAIRLVEDFPELDDVFGAQADYLKCLIEVDRHGCNEVVFYDLDYPEFEHEFVAYSKNISKAWTDIAVLGPMWNIAAANVSAGYYNEHTKNEHFFLNSFLDAEKRLADTIARFHRSQRVNRYEYRGKSATCCQLLMWYNYQEDETLPPFDLGEVVLNAN